MLAELPTYINQVHHYQIQKVREGHIPPASGHFKISRSAKNLLKLPHFDIHLLIPTAFSLEGDDNSSNPFRNVSDEF
jgi:hypothetical protein